MSRKLASVQIVKAIKPIEGADRIEIVQVLNWNCVARKGEFKEGDKVIYFEIDSLLPNIPAFEFLKGSSWSQKLNKYKISTHKFRNQISQGLVIHIKQLKEIYDQLYEYDDNPAYPIVIAFPSEGIDLTEVLKIDKYEPPVYNGPLGDIVQHEWYVPKTDEERIQVLAEDVLPKYINSKQNDWYASIKLDGTSCTAGLFNDGFFIGGRNQWFKGPNMYTETVNKYNNIEQHIKNYQNQTGKYLVFQGELCGPGIQGNKLGLKEKEWFIFNVFESETGEMDSYKKLNFTRLLNICAEFGLMTVPIIPTAEKFNFEQAPLENLDFVVETLLEYADCFKYRNYFENASPNQIAEGIVFRMNDMTYSFKVISNKFLLKGGN